jgi:hypothetical protein
MRSTAVKLSIGSGGVGQFADRFIDIMSEGRSARVQAKQFQVFFVFARLQERAVGFEHVFAHAGLDPVDELALAVKAPSEEQHQDLSGRVQG